MQIPGKTQAQCISDGIPRPVADEAPNRTSRFKIGRHRAKQGVGERRTECAAPARLLSQMRGYAVCVHMRSMHMAMPSPPPMQSEATPFFAFFWSMAERSVTITRAPEAPIG